MVAMKTLPSNSSALRWWSLACVLLLAASPGHASMFKGEALDQAADVLTWVVLILVPLIGIALFWMVHVLPEKIAHQRHHPQTKAIQVLCLLSLVFGGLLWPIAWLWAYTKPVSYRLAYGTDKSDDYFLEMAERLRAGKLDTAEVEHLREELDAIRARGAMTPEMAALRRLIDAATAPVPPAPAAAARTGGIA
jgi:CBS domain containing-hemolysin-like protein